MTHARKTRHALIIEELVDVLKDHALGLDEAKHLLADALNDYDAQMEDAYQRNQEMLAANGIPDDSQYRRDLIEAGRGHLLK